MREAASISTSSGHEIGAEYMRRFSPIYRAFAQLGTGSVEWEWLPILKQSLIQMPVQFSRDLYVAEMPGRMGICMPYVVYPINSSRVWCVNFSASITASATF